MNDQDAVPRAAKLGIWKHTGRRVLINGKGDMVVDPLAVEVSLSALPLFFAVSNHFLGKLVGTGEERMAILN